MEQNRRKWLSKITFMLAGLGLARLQLLAGSPHVRPDRTNSPAGDLNPLIPVQQDKDRMPPSYHPQTSNMKLGAFSVSLNVKDIKASQQFYENLGFTVFGGDLAKNYLIMKNGNALIGLFYGMFEKNILTFNPGWDENAKKVGEFDDVRKIQKDLKAKGIKFTSEADEKATGPAGFFIMDPDGNPILVDQHV